MPEIPVVSLDSGLLIPSTRMPAGYRDNLQITGMIDAALAGFAGSGQVVLLTGAQTKTGVLTLNDAPVMPDATVAGTGLLARLTAKVSTSLRGVANGYAGLDADGDVVNAAGVKVGGINTAILQNDWGMRVSKYINYSTGAWGTRTGLPTGYTEFVIWYSYGYSGTAAVPTNAIDGDLWFRDYVA